MSIFSRLYGGAIAMLKMSPSLLRVAWGINAVSNCRSYSRAEGPGASTEEFHVALSLYEEDLRSPWRGDKGSKEVLPPRAHTGGRGR